MVLPAAEAHERPGTTTNIEGRIFRLGQKLVPPGQAWPDWMIAGELAVHLGHDLGFDSVGGGWDEIERLAASHRGITRAVLDSHGGRRRGGPARRQPGGLARRAPLDPVAVPGVESVERQGASLQAGLAASPNAGTSAAGAADGAPAARRPSWPGTADLDVPHVSPADGYSVRLVAARALYDGGSAVEAVAGAGRAGRRRGPAGQPPGPRRARRRRRRRGPAAVGHGHPGVPVEPDPSLPRKVVAADFNVPWATARSADLVDRAFPWSTCGWSRCDPSLHRRAALSAPTRSTPRAWAGSCSPSSRSRCSWSSAPSWCRSC